jgi:hypothetical protein
MVFLTGKIMTAEDFIEKNKVGSGRQYKSDTVTLEDTDRAPAVPLDENDDLPF